MKAIFRILGTAAAVAATGAAIVIMDKLLNEKAAPIIESILIPEDAAKYDAEAAKTAEPVTPPDLSEERPVCDPEAPNPNPVEAGPAVAPKDENGKFDPTKIADVSDFGDWEEQGCKG